MYIKNGWTLYSVPWGVQTVDTARPKYADVHQCRWSCNDALVYALPHPSLHTVEPNLIVCPKHFFQEDTSGHNWLASVHNFTTMHKSMNSATSLKQHAQWVGVRSPAHSALREFCSALLEYALQSLIRCKRLRGGPELEAWIDCFK